MRRPLVFFGEARVEVGSRFRFYNLLIYWSNWKSDMQCIFRVWIFSESDSITEFYLKILERRVGSEVGVVRFWNLEKLRPNYAEKCFSFWKSWKNRRIVGGSGPKLPLVFDSWGLCAQTPELLHRTKTILLFVAFFKAKVIHQ